MKIKWTRVEGWNVCNPKKVTGWNALAIYVPYGIPECILMPGDDTIIPTGLWFPGMYRDFMIIPVHHTYPNKESDVLDVWNGKLKSNPILHMSILADRSQVLLHIINLGKTELKYKPGNTMAYFMFSKIYEYNDDWEEED